MSAKAPLPRPNWRNPIHVLAFGLGSGAAPKAPGTFGTLVAVPIVWLLPEMSLWTYLALTLAMALLGVWLCHVTARDLNVHDHPGIVWDEIVGYMITMAAAPQGWQWLLLGFVLFRFFDIVKPPPIKQIDRHVHGGLGIMLDDVLAGVFALICLQLIANFI